MNPRPILDEPILKLGKYLIVSDLHIGFELELWKQGIHVPLHTEKYAKKLTDVARKEKCKSIVLNGDVKHEIGFYRGRQAMELDKFLSLLREEFEVILIKGNHDGGLDGLKEFAVGKYLISHGHALPSEEHIGKFWITGHVHPQISFKDNSGRRYGLPVWVIGSGGPSIKEKYGQLAETKIMVMPAFNQLKGGFPVNENKKRKSVFALLDSYSLFLLDGVEIFRAKSDL